MIADSEILAAIDHAGSQRKAAAMLNINSRTLERRVARMNRDPDGPRVLVLDIETRPMLAYTWGMFQQNIGPAQVVDWGGLLCFAYKWADEDEIGFHAEWQRGGKERMVLAAWRLLNEADAVVGWNSARFDARHFNAEFQRAGLSRPTPYRNVDLMRAQKRDAFMMSNKLESRRLWLGEEGKAETGGFALWRGCMDGDRESRRLMEEYNRRDVEITQEEFDRMRAGGWVRNLPNLSIHGGHVCPSCGGDRLKAHKPYRTEVRRYALWVCLDCGAASRATKCEPGSAPLKAVT
ncbi:MAG: hypothetical protein JSR70_07630 [Proteobacteria bacterium]|nr:hypothetical protein [Pseudomonadota bacterium]